MAASRAGDWPQWRGPTGTGTTDEKDLPLRWDGKTGEGIVWKVSLTGTTGHSSPIVWGDKLFLTTAIATALASSPTADTIRKPPSAPRQRETP
jgi:hypothetical protein